MSEHDVWHQKGKTFMKIPRVENVRLWKPIFTTRHENKEKIKKCLEYPHSILERKENGPEILLGISH